MDYDKLKTEVVDLLAAGTAIIDGSVGTADADFIIDNTSIAAG